MLSLLLFLDPIFDFFNDMGFVLKIFALLAIIAFINANIQNQIIKILLSVFMIYYILIANWAVFGTLWMIYTLFGLGISSVFADIFMSVHPEPNEEQMAQMQGPQQGYPLHMRDQHHDVHGIHEGHR